MKRQENKNLKYERFSKMDYRETYNEALSDLKTNKSKDAFRIMKRMANFNPGSKILDIKRGPLLGKYSKSLKNKTLT